MARGSWTQSNFTGGQFSPAAAGRIDLPLYRSALATCMNMYPIEEGAVTRRPGTMFVQPSYLGFDGAIYPYLYSQQNSYILEFVADSSQNTWCRAYTNGHLVTDGNRVQVTAISTGTPAEITTAAATNWNTGDQIMMTVDYSALTAAQVTTFSALANRQFNVGKVDTTHFTLTDMLNNSDLVGAFNVGSLPTIYADRVTRIAAPYTGTTTVINDLRPTLAETNLIFVNAMAGVTPQSPIVVTPVNGPTATSDLTYAMTFLKFVDGPYYGPNVVDLPATATATTGTITFSLNTVTQINGGQGFLSSDVGRTIQIVQTLPFWTVGTTYTAGQSVAWPPDQTATGYTALPSSVTNVGFEPDANPTYWAPLANAVDYNYGTIVSINSTSSVQLLLANGLPGTSTSNPIIQISLGVFTSTAQTWPLAAVFFEGRLIFSFGQTLFGSTTGGYLDDEVVMSPNDTFGNVLDSSGFQFTLVGPNVNQINWMHPDAASVILGTAGSEWQIQASQLGDPLTPTSFQAHQVTQIGSQYLLPVRPGIAMLFVNRYTQRLIEYLSDPFTSKYSGKPINIYAQNLGNLGQIEYQDAPNPIVWAISSTGDFLSGLYRRVSYFASEMPTLYGWGQHSLSGGYNPEFIANGYNNAGSTDQLYMFVTDGTYRYVFYMLPPFVDGNTLPQAQFVDAGMTGVNYNQVENGIPVPFRYEGIYAVTDGQDNLYFNGLYYHAGKTVSVWYAGLDFGDHVVSATGVVGPVPFNSDVGALGSEAYFKNVQTNDTTSGSIPTRFNEDGANIWVPGIIGFTYTSTVKRLRADSAQDGRTQSGPAAGQLKRHHWYSITPTAAVTGTINVTGGNAFDATSPAVFNQQGTAVTTGVLFSGVHSDTIDNTDDLDGQPQLSVSRMAPFTLSSWSGFIETEEL